MIKLYKFNEPNTPTLGGNHLKIDDKYRRNLLEEEIKRNTPIIWLFIDGLIKDF